MANPAPTRRNRQLALNLSRAAQNGDVAEVEKISAMPEVDVNMATTVANSGAGVLGTWNALQRAAHGGHMAVVKALLLRPDLELSPNPPALLLAARSGHGKVAEALLDDPRVDDGLETRDERGLNALMYAAENGLWKVIKKYVETGRTGGINEAGRGGATPLLLAVRKGHTKVVLEILKANNVDLAVKDRNGSSALTVALRKGHAPVVALLQTAYGSEDVNTTEPPLVSAVKTGSLPLVQQLLEWAPKKVNDKDREGERSAIHWAVEASDEKIIAELLKCPVTDVNSSDKMGRSALMVAADKGYAKMACCLLNDSRVNVNHADVMNKTALMLSSAQGHVGVVVYLLQSKTRVIDVDATDIHGDTAFLMAARNGHREAMKVLLNSRSSSGSGVKVNRGDFFGKTALHLASERGHVAAARWLAGKAGADLAKRDCSGQTAREAMLNNPAVRESLTRTALARQRS